MTPHHPTFDRMHGKAIAVSVALDERDRATHAHCDRVTDLSLEIGISCGLSSRELAILATIAAFHDVGKIGIPDRVLNKVDRFTDDDRAIMQTHSTRGERIIRAAELEEGDEIALAVRHHHERFDGAGYPDGLAGEAIPYFARIVAVADTYDAMARMRVYRHGRAHREIMEVMQHADGQQHDPYLIARFADVIERSALKSG